MRSQVAVRNNISKSWNTTENDVSKNQSSAHSAIRLPNTSLEISEFLHKFPEESRESRTPPKKGANMATKSGKRLLSHQLGSHNDANLAP
ncbi:hypothetical protein TNCV_897461 [Trichonephila clavipes]|nr:hypothetical protein TNCV_897461 [Trichonephila clavipes]